MITNIRIRNFKTLNNVEFQLGGAPVVLVGPNNCGKTSILQALTMWHHGAAQWCKHRTWRKKEDKIPRGFSIPANEFSALVSPYAQEIWRGKFIGRRGRNSQQVKIGIDVSGRDDEGELWDINTEFTYSSAKVVRCGPAPDENSADESSADIAERWKRHLPRVAFLQPMSGMSGEEEELTSGAINVRLGRGETANVLRNICHQLLHPEDEADESVLAQRREHWEDLKAVIRRKFGVALNDPERDKAKGQIVMSYKEDGKEYDLSSGGRGFHQTLLLLAYLHSNPNTVILLDEPDAHLETIRQRDNFSMYSEVAEKLNSQLIIASHSEVVINRSNSEGIVGVIRGESVHLDASTLDSFKRLLTAIGWDKIMRAVINGHIAFFEGYTDIEFLAAFAEKLFNAEAAERIRRANAEQVGNDVGKARKLFYGLRSAVPNLRGFALFDQDTKNKMRGAAADDARRSGLIMECWRRREVENYLLLPDVLRRHAQDPKNKEHSARLFMDSAIKRTTAPAVLENREDESWRTQSMKEYIRNVFAEFRKQAGGAPWDDSRCYTLVQYMEPDEIDTEVREKILALLKVIDPEFNPGKSR